MDHGKKYHVLVTDSIDPTGVDILSSVAVVDRKTKLTEEEICEVIGGYDALMVRSGTQVTTKIIEKGKRLKIIGRAGVGVDNVDVVTATKSGIFVVNSPLGNTVAAAEHTLALMLALSRHVAAGDASMRDGKWDRSRFVGTQLQHKILGVIGLGQVGSHVARVCREMGMQVYAYDPFVNELKAKALGCTICSLHQIFQEADYITLHVPLIEQTKNMICAETISMMKPTARVINCSRGGVVNEVDICAALISGKLGGAALDVFEVEKGLPSDSPLLTAPNLIMTPHLGASTHEAQVNVAVDVAQQIKETLLGSIPESAVNIPGLRPSEMESLRPLLSCGNALGRVAAQLLIGPVETISVTLEGCEYAEERGEPALLAVANGVLGMFVAHRVNFVNVRHLAEQHKIKLVVSKESFHVKNSVRVELSNGKDQAVVRGTITEDGDVLLKLFKGIPVFMIMPESTPDKPTYMFYSIHSDSPGSLTHITSVLAASKINVANCHLGRTKGENGDMVGICLFHVDSPLTDDILQNIRAIESVKECSWCLAPHAVMARPTRAKAARAVTATERNGVVA
eukprot:GHVS01091987.1.p1 GENE.GHVS01091987.1~~GHVS01091987.1.p1  ORF type:complete len:569 (-),score=84.42 GHVS01091987.1:322-2028(-)